jgi:NACHT domain
MSNEPSIFQQAQGNYIAQATQGGTATVNVVLPSPAVQEQNRVRFLARLRYQYKEIWEQSLQGSALMMLDLTERPDDVLHHAGLLFLSGHQPDRSLPPGTSILSVYDHCGQELLILGEPGAGKSTLLLDLARHLVERAEQDAGHPLPVILSLSTWTLKPQPLQDWLPAQLSLTYDIPLQVSRGWIHTNQILPLLDGLDEVPQATRVTCIKAITNYHKDHLVPLVVCSRRIEYEEIERKQRLILNSAIVVEPLTMQQVETYLAQGGPSFAAVRAVLHTNLLLRDLTTTPLMLGIVTLTYAYTQTQDIPRQGSIAAMQQEIFTTYIEHMIERKGDPLRYPLQSTRIWLRWLARQMQTHSQAVFYLEHLQPDWLIPEQQRVYTWLAVRLPGVIIGMLTSVCIALLLNFVTPDPGHFVQQCLLGGFLGGLLNRSVHPSQSGPVHQQGRGRGKLLAMSVLIGLLFALIFGWLWTPNNWIYYEAGFGLDAGLSSLFIQFIAERQAEGVHLTERLTWTLRSLTKSLLAAKHIKTTLLLMSVVALNVLLTYILRLGLSLGLSLELSIGLSAGLSVGLSVGLIYWILLGLFQGISQEQIEDRFRHVPNQGIRRSFRNSMLLGIISAGVAMVIDIGSFGLRDIGTALTVGLAAWMSYGQGRGLSYWINFGLSDGLASWVGEGPANWLRGGLPLAICTGLIVWIVTGGLATLRHYTIRLLLWHSHLFPWRAFHFLDDATTRILLRHVGGGYSFVHRLILESFTFWDDTRLILPRPSQNPEIREASSHSSSIDEIRTTSGQSQPPEIALLRTCTRCGYQETTSGARFCPRCGNPLV